jgi:hypothetical protein
MNREKSIDLYESFGCSLIPCGENKKPISKFTGKYDDEGKQIWSWKKSKGITYSKPELLAAPYVSIEHEASGTADIDFDDSALHAHKFSSLLPATHAIGKKYNGSGIPTPNHFLYFKPEDVEVKTNSYGKNTDAGCIIELLPNTQSRYVGSDLHITHDTAPKRLTESELQQIQQTVKEIYFLAMASQYYPPKHKKRRDEYVMRLAGVMALHTDWSISKREDYLKRLLIANNDTDEVKNRIDKIKKQEKKFKEGKDVYGIPALVKFLKADAKEGLDWIDVIKKGNDVKEYPLVDGHELTRIEYPPVRFILRPIFTERGTNQIYGSYGGGKTIFALSASMAMCSGENYVGFNSEKKVPTGYIESELPGDDFKDRRNTILQGYSDEKKKFNFDWHFTLTADDLRMAGFKYGFSPIAVSANLSNPDAADYGKRGREYISSWVRRIERKTGVKPFFFLDNITMLTSFDENRAQDWSPLMKWLIHEKNNGFANCFIHHPNKSTLKGGSSGSNAKERLLDTSIALEKLDHKHRFALGGNKNVQCKVSFDKGRNFAGSDWDKEFMLTMTEEGKWTKYPMLDKYDFLIIEGHNRGLSVDDMKEEFDDLKLAVKTIYKRLKKLKDLGIIKK